MKTAVSPPKARNTVRSLCDCQKLKREERILVFGEVMTSSIAHATVGSEAKTIAHIYNYPFVQVIFGLNVECEYGDDL